jgi:hypothetical protein
MIWNIFNKKKASFKTLKTYCLFIGYPRSGHSLIGAMLDAHPNCVISHELNVLQLLKQHKSKNQIFNMILKNSRDCARSGRKNEGYEYEVKKQWQGKHKELSVIGDKQGGRTSRMLSREPGLLNQWSDVLNIEMKVLHVYRNPFDNIASRSKGGNLNRKTPSAETITKDIEAHFVQADTNNTIRKEGHFEVLDIHYESFVSSPELELTRSCSFLGLEAATEHYLKDCASIVFERVHKTRFDICFPKNLVKTVSNKIKKYDFLAEYSFDE